MKNILVLSAAVLVFTATSCRKERTCDCKTTTTSVRTGFGAQTTVSVDSEKITMEKQKKKEFKYSNDCFSMTSKDQYSSGSGATASTTEVTMDRVCELK